MKNGFLKRNTRFSPPDENNNVSHCNIYLNDVYHHATTSPYKATKQSTSASSTNIQPQITLPGLDLIGSNLFSSDRTPGTDLTTSGLNVCPTVTPSTNPAPDYILLPFQDPSATEPDPANPIISTSCAASGPQYSTT